MDSFKFESIEDLIFNKSFRNWVLRKQSPDTAFWEAFVMENSDRLSLVNDAKAIIYALQINFKGLTEEDINEEIRKVLYKARNQPDTIEEPFRQKSFYQFVFGSPYSIAAGVLFLMIVCATWYFAFEKSDLSADTYAKVFEREIQNETKYKNVSDTLQVFYLPDKSKIFLSPNSILSYDKNFEITDRKVYLSGEAFFEVSKNASKPFFVFTNTIVTKVLGTSFRVKAYPSNKMSVVMVRTGKVSVIKASHFTETIAKSVELGEVLITPNQQVTYIPENNDFNKSITEKPLLVTEPAKSAFQFDSTPLKTVFKTMENAYGVPILFDEDVLSSCSLSASMGDEDFFDKLNIICKAINASYEMIDGNIFITSDGCK